jgi:flavin reductase
VNSASGTVIDPAALRRTLALFCTGVTVITAEDPEHGARGMTANAFMSGSLVPPMIVVSIAASARLHRTVNLTSRFGVSILPASLEREARRFAGLPVDAHDPPKLVWHEGVPLVAGSLGWFAAQTAASYDVGDHTLFVGELLAFGVEEPAAAPLAYHASRFLRMPSADNSAELEFDRWGDGLIDLWG